MKIQNPESIIQNPAEKTIHYSLFTNNKGIALVLVLILALIGLAIVSSLMYMMTTGTRSSGAEKFYRTADEAALGGARIGTDLITQNVDLATAVPPGALIAPLLGTPLVILIGDDILPVGVGSTDACLTQKLSLTPGVNFANWGACNANMRNLDPADRPDMRFTLNGVPNDYNVDYKIVDTIEGNTAGEPSGAAGGGAAGTGTGGLSTGGVGGGGATITTPARTSWMYRIEVQAQSTVNPRERARYSILYAH